MPLMGYCESRADGSDNVIVAASWQGWLEPDHLADHVFSEMGRYNWGHGIANLLELVVEIAFKCEICGEALQ